MVTIRDFQEQDIRALWSIYFNTIRYINIRDYSPAQVEAWAPDNVDADLWAKRVQARHPFIAESDGVIVGYTDLQENGLVDHFFCHHKYQGCGVGRALMNHVFEQAEIRNINRLYSEVSITARPFYERMGFVVIKEQQVLIRGQRLRNFVMEKSANGRFAQV
ncbi:acetyltransferase [Agarivorans sp. OAG1]|uniref:GNAT family N-acetyltransferase n=1 Tax=Agarivorans sp. OAG1 TaxID=3082387 RepID=UPI002B2B94C1|nr:acetyltransferase [Agarivorans sp. OAG1]